MADDLDDLLDEIESKFCKDSTAKKPVKPTESRGSQNPHTRAPRKPADGPVLSRDARSKKEGDELGDMIRDICTDDGPEIPTFSTPVSGSSTSSHKESATTHKFKCLNLYLGGTNCSKGLCTVSEQRSCDQLRCTSCDFKVVQFEHYEWQKDCDYLFFRNNVPDFQKLKTKLIPRRGVRAYACQCTWRSICNVTDILLDSKLKWVCGKHV